MEPLSISRTLRRVALVVLAQVPLYLSSLSCFGADSSGTNSSSVFDPNGRSMPGRDLKLDGGLFSGRMKFSNKPELPSPGPGTGEPGMNRRDFLRMKDAKEEKENWMYLERGQLQREREKKEDEGGLRSRWDIQEDLRKKSWLDYGSQKSSGESSASGTQPEARSQAQYEAELRDRQLFDRKEGSKRFDGSLSPNSRKTTSTTRDATATHQVGELNLRDLVGGAPSRYEENGDLSFKDVFGGDYINLKERETAQTKRLDFQNFLNQSRVPTRAATDSGPAMRDPLPSGLQHSFGSFGRVAGRDGWGDGLSPASGSSPVGGGFDRSVGSPFNPPRNPSVPAPGFESPRSYITPIMMQPPKRRF